MSSKKNKPQKDLPAKKDETKEEPAPRRRSCAGVNQTQNDHLSKLCSKKANTLSCRCSGCDSDDKYPVISSASDAPLFNTAYDGSGGFLTSGTDSNWELGLGDASGLSSVSSWNPAPVFFHGSPWATSPFGNAYWLGNKDPLYVHSYFRYKFNLSSSVNPATFALTLDFYADDHVEEIYVNGAKQSSLPNGAGVIPGGHYAPGGAARITLDNHWRQCENEIIVHVWSTGGAPMGLLVQNALEVKPDEKGCDCHCDCHAVEFPRLQPCISVKWGDTPCDCMETDDVEVLCVTVCNCYSNVTFGNLSIGQIVVTDMAGQPVPTLPDGTPSVQVIPSGPICFGDIGPCRDKDHPTCVSRELVLYTRGAIGKKYRLSFNAVCFNVCHEYQSEQCFTIKLCQD
jgi:hypothetical protein